jgi:drug/metabolite transporter (DMT)-like permease
VSFAESDNIFFQIEPHRLGAIAWTGIMTTVVAIYLEGVALQVASATEASLLFASEPVWASLFGAWLLHETLGINSYIGGAIILSACVLSAASEAFGEDDEPSSDAEVSESKQK